MAAFHIEIEQADWAIRQQTQNHEYEKISWSSLTKK